MFVPAKSFFRPSLAGSLLSLRASRVQFDGRHDQTFVLADDGARRLPLAWRVHAFCWCRVRRLADLGRRHAEGCSTAAGRSGLRRVHGAPAAPGRSAKCGAEHCPGARHHRCRCADWRSPGTPGTTAVAVPVATAPGTTAADALGIETDDVAKYVFPKTWPIDREQRARIIGEWLQTEARFLA